MVYRPMWLSHDFILALDGNDDWVILNNDHVELVKYYPNAKAWLGMYHGKLIKMNWPSFSAVIKFLEYKMLKIDNPDTPDDSEIESEYYQ